MSQAPRTLGRVGWLAAEFVVVALGVAMGLAVDEWRQGRDDAEMELRYLRGLHDDLAADTAEIARLVGWTREREEAIEDALASLTGSAPMPQDPVEALTAVGFALNQRPWNVQDATFRQLLAQGDLGRISSPDLRQRLIAYHYRADGTRALAERWEGWREALERLAMQVLPVQAYRYIVGVGRFSPSAEPFAEELALRPSETVAARATAALRSDSELLNLPERSRVNHGRPAGLGGSAVEAAGGLLEEVGGEIVRLGGS